MFRHSEPFEKQFRWEVDRWVFRFRQRGTPVEVTEIERDRLVARHIHRTKTVTRAWIGGVLAAGALTVPLLRFDQIAPYIVPLYFALAVTLRFVLAYWADQAVTLHLRERLPIGEKLGLFGTWMMRAEVTPWPQLLLGCAAIASAGALIFGVPADQFGQMERWTSIAVVSLAAVTVALLITVKLMVDWRERRRQAWRQELDAAREMRVD